MCVDSADESGTLHEEQGHNKVFPNEEDTLEAIIDTIADGSLRVGLESFCNVLDWQSDQISSQRDISQYRGFVLHTCSVHRNDVINPFQFQCFPLRL